MTGMVLLFVNLQIGMMKFDIVVVFPMCVCVGVCEVPVVHSLWYSLNSDIRSELN